MADTSSNKEGICSFLNKFLISLDTRMVSSLYNTYAFILRKQKYSNGLQPKSDGLQPGAIHLSSLLFPRA